MEFARKELEKFGWEEGESGAAISRTSFQSPSTGQGLGREGNGISRPIQVALKRDTAGVSVRYLETKTAPYDYMYYYMHLPTHTPLNFWQLGVAPGEEFSSVWWSEVFNRSAKNISVCNDLVSRSLQCSTVPLLRE